MPTIRQEQIARRLVEELSAMLHRDLKDPRLSMVTVTTAEVSRDLRYARVFVSTLGDTSAADAAIVALRGAAGFIRGEFTRRAGLRVAPEIDFQKDEGIARGARVVALLREIETETPADNTGTA